MQKYLTWYNLKVAGIISVCVYIAYLNGRLKVMTQFIANTIKQKEEVINQQKNEIETKANKIKEQNTQIQNLNNEFIKQRTRIEQKDEQMRQAQAHIQQKEQSHQENVLSLKNQVIKVKEQQKNMIRKITQELDTEIVSAIRQGIAHTIKEYLNKFNELEDKECI